MDKQAALEALAEVGEATAAARAAEVRQSVALARLAESYRVGVDDVVEALAEKLVYPGDDGVPGVSEFLSLELGAALGMSHWAALGVVADVLNIKHRMPGLWRSFCAGLIPRWQAAKLVELTSDLGLSEALWVDERLGSRVGRVSFERLRRVVRGLVAQADPEGLAVRERKARQGRGVWFQAMTDGSTDAFATLAPMDARALDRTLAEVACAMGEAGDERSYQQRRAAALGVLADPRAALSWLEGVPAAGRRKPRGRAVVYVHLAAETVVDPSSGVARIEGFGPLSTASLPEFLAGVNVTVRPVVAEGRVAGVDSYEIPERVRESVLRRRPVEVFPFSARASRGLDLDHVVPYRHHSGIPGQTSVGNLAPLSRLVHRAKTAGVWRLKAMPDGHYEWWSPLGLGYTVASNGSTGPPGSAKRPKNSILL